MFSWRKLLDERLEEIIMVLTMVGMVLLIFAQVFFRSVVGSSLTWGEELARYLHIWQIWIGASLAVRKGEHVGVTVFRNLFNPTIKKALTLLALLSWFIFSLFLAIEGTKFVNYIFSTGQTTPSMGILTGIPYLAIPIGGTLMSIRLIQQIYFLFKGNLTESKGDVV